MSLGCIITDDYMHTHNCISLVLGVILEQEVELNIDAVQRAKSVSEPNGERALVHGTIVKHNDDFSEKMQSKQETE